MIVLNCCIPNVIKQFWNVLDHIDSLDWIKNKNAAINPINYDDKCFQYAATVALNHEIGKNPHTKSKIKLFTNKYDLKGTNYQSVKNDLKKFENNNPTIALNV